MRFKCGQSAQNLAVGMRHRVHCTNVPGRSQGSPGQARLPPRPSQMPPSSSPGGPVTWGAEVRTGSTDRTLTVWVSQGAWRVCCQHTRGGGHMPVRHF